MSLTAIETRLYAAVSVVGSSATREPLLRGIRCASTAVHRGRPTRSPDQLL